MGETIICIIANMFRVYIVYRFMGVFFNQSKVDKKTELFLYGIYYVINTWLYIEFHLAWVNLVNTLLGIILISLLYTNSIKKGFFVSTLIYILNMICDILSTIPFTSYQEGENTDQILFVLGNLLFLICELLAGKIVNRKDNKEYHNLPLILVPICSVSIIFYMVYSDDILGTEVVIVGIGLMLVNFLVLNLYSILMDALSQSYESEILKQKVNMYSNQLNLIIANEDKLSTLRHDMKHHLNELKLLAIKEDNKEIQHYIDSMVEFVENPNEIVCSGNTEIDSLLNYMLKRAKEELKVVDVKVQLPKDISFSFDINVILGNLLENALEAASLTEDKILKCKIQLRKNILKIRLENSYTGNLEKEKDGYLTSKADKKKHGIGLKSVQNMVKKYDGIIEISEEDLFCVKVILYM